MDIDARRSAGRAWRSPLVLVVALGVALAAPACDDDEAPPSPAERKLPLPLEIGAGPTIELPRHVVLASDSSRLQRVELDIDSGGRLDVGAPMQLADRVVLATANEQYICLVVERGREHVVERLTVEDPGAPGLALELPGPVGTPTALFSHGAGCVVAIGSEVRFFDFAASRPFSVRVFDLPPGRTASFFAHIGRALWVFDAGHAPHVVHAIDVGRELPRYLVSWPLPSLDAPAEFRDAGALAAGDDDEASPAAVLLATVDGRDQLLGLAPGCRPDEARSCLVWAARAAAPAREPATGLLIDGDLAVLATRPDGLLTTELPSLEPLDDDEPMPEITREVLELEALDGLDGVRDVRRWGDALLVLRDGGGRSGAELVLARLDTEGDASIVTRIEVPADVRHILGADDARRAR